MRERNLRFEADRVLDDPKVWFARWHRSACARCPVTGNSGRTSGLSPPSWEARKVDALALWLDRCLASDRQGEAVLLDAHGRPMEERGRQRLKARNNRPVAIQE